jgi:hypothetical protein
MPGEVDVVVVDVALGEGDDDAIGGSLRFGSPPGLPLGLLAGFLLGLLRGLRNLST